MNKAETTKLHISKVKLNKSNPRLIKDDKFTKLVASIKEFPEMLEVRPIVINTENVVLGGNMRFRAAKEAGYTEVPVQVVDWPEDKQRQFIIKDNLAGGEWDWDILANEWDTDILTDWGLDLPAYHSLNSEDMDNLPDFDNVLSTGAEFQIIITFQDNEVLKDFLKDKKIALDNNYVKRGNKLSFNWPLEERRDIKSVEFQ